MKQAMQSKASDQCSKCNEGWVSSAKGYHQRIRTTSMDDKIITQQSMKQHENDFNPGPLTVSGFNGGSCCQDSIPRTDRTPVKPAAKGRNRFKANPGICLSDFGFVMQGDAIHKMIKRILQKHAENSNIMNPGINHIGAPESGVATEFRRRTNQPATCHEKTGVIALNTCICSFTQCDGVECIYPGKNLQLPRRAVNRHSGIIASRQMSIQITGKKPVRSRKTRQLKWLNEYSNRREQRTEIGIEIYNGFTKN